MNKFSCNRYSVMMLSLIMNIVRIISKNVCNFFKSCRTSACSNSGTSRRTYSSRSSHSTIFSRIAPLCKEFTRSFSSIESRLSSVGKGSSNGGRGSCNSFSKSKPRLRAKWCWTSVMKSHTSLHPSSSWNERAMSYPSRSVQTTSVSCCLWYTSSLMTGALSM